MKKIMHRFPIIVLLALIPACSLSSGACGSGIEPTPPPEEPTMKTVEEVETAPPEQEAKDPVSKPDDGPGPYDCNEDGDCTNTCGGGALNFQWLQAHMDQVPSCKDGCAGKGIGSPICVEGSCVAIDRDGNVDEYCTRRLDKTE